MVLWQISDLHFGKYNVLEPEPRELAAMLAKAATDYPTLAPHVLLVSGDVSSIAADNEFDEFVQFCSDVSGFLGKSRSAPPILVVPGNHDVHWMADGTADRMKGFRERVSNQGCCITPFGPASEERGAGSISIIRVDPNSDSTPPFATVRFKDLDLEIVLLISGYFSGSVPKEVRDTVTASPSKDELEKLLRCDQGAVNREYLLNLATMPSPSTAYRLGLIHHNPVQYGTAPCANRLAPQFLETLFKHGVRVVLHGHVHLSEDYSSSRPVSPKLAS